MCNDSINCIINETLNGYIDLKDSCYHTIWQSIGLNASITIKTKNLSNQVMRLIIENRRKIIIKICPNDEVSITASNVHRISVQCFSNDDEKACTGSYQLMLHFPVDFITDNKSSNCKYDDTGWYVRKSCTRGKEVIL